MGISQEELAEKVYVSRQTVSNWETGKNYPDIHSVLLLSSVFNVSLDQLIKGDVEIMKNEIKETEIKKLSTNQVNSINVGGNFLYYYMDSSGGGTGLGYVVRTYGVYRSKLNGNDSKCLDRNAAVTMQLVGDYIYYQRYNNKDFTKFYKVKTDKTENELVSDMIINPAACYNGVIYFNGTEENHYLYSLDTRTGLISTVFEGNLWYPAYNAGYIYYMDVS